MDIVTQGIVGAIAAQSIASRRHVRHGLIIGFLAGLPADADIFIRSSSDPLLTLEFHRQFSHSLLFIPLGGLLCALLLRFLFRQQLAFKSILLFATIAYATSGLLDACTSYGTQLLWPFSEARIAWRIIAVFDPLFSVVLLFLLILGWYRRSYTFARAGVLFAFLYFSFGLFQHAQAEKMAYAIASVQGHTVTRLVVKPTMGNVFLWRVLYQHKDRFYFHALHIPPFATPRYRQGENLPVWTPDKIPPGIDKKHVIYQDMLRFQTFSDGYMVEHPQLANALGDARYALLPHRGLPLWGIVWDVGQPDQHVTFENWRPMTPQVMQTFIALLTGSDPELLTIVATQTP